MKGLTARWRSKLTLCYNGFGSENISPTKEWILTPNQKILVVDDDNVSVKVIINHLKEAHYLVDSANQGKEAWEMLTQYPEEYAVILVDRMMMGVDGMELLRRIKQSPPLQNIPVIMITGQAQPEEHVDAIAAGVFDFLYKPIEKDLLLFLVQKALEQSQKNSA